MRKLKKTPHKKIAKGFFSLFLFMVISLTGFSQSVSINATGNPPNASAGVDIDFANKGLLIPRVALTGTAISAPIAAHVAGMIVYNIATIGNVTPGFYFNDGAKWVSTIVSGNAAGEMQYWNGTAWVSIPAGIPGQLLQLNASGIPSWSVTIYNIN